MSGPKGRLGDALMAIWGAPVERKDEEARAIRCALQMVERVHQMNEVRQREGRLPLQIGVGLNTGRVVFGAMGATRRMDLTLIGDAVNVASRLCDEAEPGQVIAAGGTTARVANELDPVPARVGLLRGKAKATRSFVVRGERAKASAT